MRPVHKRSVSIMVRCRSVCGSDSAVKHVERGINRVRRKKEPRMELASRGLVDSDFRWRSFELTHFNCACSSSNNVKFHRP